MAYGNNAPTHTSKRTHTVPQNMVNMEYLKDKWKLRLPISWSEDKRRLSYLSPWTCVITKVLSVDQLGRRVRFRETFEDADVKQGHEPRNAVDSASWQKQIIP